MAAPVVGVTLEGLTFSHTATTFLEGYEVTSGGDWSIHRDAGERRGCLLLLLLLLLQALAAHSTLCLELASPSKAAPRGPNCFSRPNPYPQTQTQTPQPCSSRAQSTPT